MQTPVVAELTHHCRIELSRYNPDKIESVIESFVEGSQFPLATALQIATFFKLRAANNLSKKYQRLLNSVE